MKTTLQWIHLDPVQDAVEECGDRRDFSRYEWKLAYREARIVCRANIKRLCATMSRPGATFGSFSGVEIVQSDSIH